MPTTRRRAALGLLVLVGGAPAFRVEAEDIQDIPNVFISPCGQPFRAKPGAPYPVADWFKRADRDGDGKLTRDEFVGDAAAFFKTLDLNGDGFLSPREVTIYENRICPEILGVRVLLSIRTPLATARLWLAQYDRPGPVDPGGDQAPPTPKTKAPDESTQGASPYSFFDEPEPVMAADLNFTGVISKTNFLKLADIHFKTLDRAEKGYLTLSGLPETPIQKRIDKAHRPRR
ncbi:MAG: EF-hand domain-containing protein [Caulobacteraceae bacterium]